MYLSEELGSVYDGHALQHRLISRGHAVQSCC
jgi:hypothetical protein